MQTSITEPTGDTKKLVSKRKAGTETLSADGLWRSFKQVPNLLQYVPNGNYFARVKVKGKVIRKSLATGTYTTAKLLLLDFLKEQTTKRKPVGSPVTFGEAEEIYRRDTDSDYTLAKESKTYRLNCLKKITKTWPQLAERKLSTITDDECNEWTKRLIETEIDDQYFNNVLGAFRAILKIGRRLHVKRGGTALENPAEDIKRLGVKSKVLQLPEQNQFFQLIETVATAGSGHSKHCADLIRFIAFSGCRVSEAKKILWRHVDFEKNVLTIHGAKSRRDSNDTGIRQIPIIAPMRELLEKLKPEAQPDKPVCNVHECEKSMTAACKKISIKRITHHDLRHLFATTCIESGVDIPTVSRWLGHSDGGALAMKTYGHLRQEHSAAMALKVSFGNGGAK